MKKSCLLWVVFFLALSAGYYALVHGRVSSPGNVFLSLFGGVVMTMLAGSTWTFLHANEEIAALRRAREGVAPVDGRLEAAAGPIYPLGEPLLSPLEGKECVAYESEIGPRRSREGGAARDAVGYALTPCAIRTPFGSMRFLGWSMLEPFQRRLIQGPEAQERARRWLKEATFDKMGIRNILSVVSEMMTDDDGALRRDFRITEGAIPVEQRVLEERAVGVGESVVALGIYSAEKGGLVPRKTGGMTVNQLFPGTIQMAIDRQRKSAMTGFVFAIVFAAVFHAFLWLAIPAHQG